MSRFKSTFGLALAFSGVLVPLSQPLWAQPNVVAPAPEIAALAAIEAKVRAKTLSPQEQLAAYEGLLRDYPQASVPVAMRAILKVSGFRLKLNNDSAGALAIVQDAWGARDLSGFPTERLQLALTQSKLLLGAQQAAEADAILEENWEAMARISTPNAVPLYKQRVATLEALGKDREAVVLLQDIRYDNPSMLDGIADLDWMWDKIIESHLANVKTDKPGEAQALRWAKLRFMLCEFDEAALSRATSSLTLVWAILDAPQIQAFLAAQDDPAKTNPLAAVAVPEFDPARAPDVTDGVGAKWISLLLCSNTPQSQKLAMIKAFKLASARTTAERGTAEVCRVFKACDLDTRRANAFLASFKEPKGAVLRAQLVAEFLAERSDAA